MKLSAAKSTMTIVAGMGPVAWDRDDQKVSMHPPLPGHVDLVAQELEKLEHQQHMVHRRHPENDTEFTLVRHELTVEELQPHHRHNALHHDHSECKQMEEESGKHPDVQHVKKNHYLHRH